MSETPEPGAPTRAPVTPASDRTRALISFGLILAAIAASGALAFVPTENAAQASQGVSWLQGAAMIAIGYWLGSSKGSADKTALMGKGSQP